MVATIGAISSSAAAANYFESDDYYADGGISPSEWQGEGAKALGLSGEVNRETFRAILDGSLPHGQQLGTMREGKLQHRPGWDVTMSAPKSVSIMAEVAGDRRLVVAHNNAVKAALAYVERHAAATRIRADGGVEQRQTTDNLVIASFRHDTSRAQDPQLHTHNVIMNMTQDAEGNWRSLEPRALYQLQKAIGAVYRQELAVGVRALGYAIEQGKDSLFEIKGVPAAVIRAFSERAAQVEARLAERGQTRATASAEEKQIAALDTREAKQSLERGELVANWRAEADAAGFGKDAREALVAASKEVVASLEHGSALAAQGQIAAHQAVALAAATLGERQAVFAAAELEKEAGRYGLGRVTAAQISAAVARAQGDGALVPRTFLDKRGAEFAGFTTAENIAHERQLLRLEAEGRGTGAPILSVKQAASAVARAELKSDHPWNEGQRAATRALLTSPHRVTGLQGYAGTAKTTTVLATYAREAQARGVAVTALAPTASAAQTLGDALGQRGETVARQLARNSASLSGGVWIVDEASLLSARDMAALLSLAADSKARVVLVGDVKQLGSVGAGAAFAQLQSAGMATARLDNVVRQTNAATREAVLASIEGDARRALDALERGGGKIIAHGSQGERFAAMAKAYAALDASERARTLVIEPSRDGRDALTTDIRRELASSGALSGPAVTMDSLVAKNLSRIEARDPASYSPGDTVRFLREYADKGVTRGTAYRVERVDPDKAAITIKSADGSTVDWRLRQWGAGKVEVFEPKPMELQAGDRVQFTRNDREAGRINGLRGTVTAIDPKRQQATIALANGREQRLDLSDPRDAHLRHAYVQTAHAAQGQTAERVLIHADSRSANLVDQKMLYVALSRARSETIVVTDDKARLIRAIHERAGEKQTAMEVSAPEAAKTKSLGAGLG
ncbi:relaxase domain-containing protein [Novosphingobium sp. NBM11]|jgi:conjugative relaxase-like TrwC/TraI family protein|uniref:MobF family relaxase n=1 Tax=Novosphingobium sp. NBM11 TaxID=2596914 RepID=UPI001892761F|nr:MobF family relaxase [Novosphingobium sp. NBM11]MBA4040419.1 exonuclease V subunit alpha [Sphingobium sp.]MBF5089577.1 relaxase domain-containing protein [Novosphingobium sp. NBM11]